MFFPSNKSTFKVTKKSCPKLTLETLDVNGTLLLLLLRNCIIFYCAPQNKLFFGSILMILKTKYEEKNTFQNVLHISIFQKILYKFIQESLFKYLREMFWWLRHWHNYLISQSDFLTFASCESGSSVQKLTK